MAACSTPAEPGGERRVTAGIGAAQSPVLSRDGASIAFAAVAAGYTNPQIWTVRADGAAPPRPLTSDASQNYDPEFSPDGRDLFFTSSRAPQGIYRVPATGGVQELAIANGYSAKISPDGRTLVYGSGGKVVQRPLAGGAVSVLLPAIENSFAPIWSPDSTRVLVTTTTPPSREQDWWIARPAGGEPLKTSLGADLRSQGFNSVRADAWLADDWIVFDGRQGETQTLWKVRLAPDGRTLDKAVRASGDAEGDSAASFAAGKLVFVRTQVDMNFWALPLDSSGEHVTASPEPLTVSPGRKGQQSVAGSKLLYSGEEGNRFSLFLKEGGKQKKLRDGFYSLIEPDGSRYVYGDGTKERLNLFVRSLSWWSFRSSALCESCGMPRAFSPDGSKLLLWSDSPPSRHLDLLDLSTRKIDAIVASTNELYAPRLSRDGRWVTFIVQTGDQQWRGFAAPVNGRTTGPAGWIPLTAPSNQFFYLFPSSREDLIYLLSSHGEGGNLRYLDVQRLDAASKRPSGAATPVYQFDESLVPGMDPIWNPISLDGNRIILELGGVGTNIWIR